MSHTPGPWVVSQHGIWGDVRHDLVVAFAAMVGSMSEADARLIAAAPDLLEAAKAVLQWAGAGTDGSVLDDLRAAIAKAEGRA